jgi:putative endonuclease
MKHVVYILQSLKTNRYYCGQTQNLSERLKRHNTGRNKSTRPERPWNLVWKAEVADRSEAVLLETKIKKRGIQRFLDAGGSASR